jgi:hypothetical protein
MQRVDTPPRDGDCKGLDPNIWYPHADKTQPGNFSDNYRRARMNTGIALQICSNCHAKEECLSYGLYHEHFGIWGGLTERERHTLRRKLNIFVIPREPINILLPN